MTTTTAANMFNNIIGQDAAKRKLSFFIQSYETKGHIPHVLFTAPKGTGKTMLAKELGRNLLDPDTLKPKAFLELYYSQPQAICGADNECLHGKQ